MESDFVLYGSTGYVGQAAARIAVDHGLRPLLVGRNSKRVASQAGELGLEYRIVPLDRVDLLETVLENAPVVLNCAGPYLHTHGPIVDACLATGTHYIDVTGEPPVFDSIASRDGEARSKGVMLLPAAGFDVVPTDCLAAHLKSRLPTATELTLAFTKTGPAGLPPGTLKTMVELIPHGSSKRRRTNGNIEDVEGPRPTRAVDCGRGPVDVSLITWGDIFLAFRSTGIPNIDVYAALGPQIFSQMDMTDRMSRLFKLGPVRAVAKRALRGGSTEDERARTSSLVWGEVRDEKGNTAVSCLHGPEPGQVWTARSAVNAVTRVLEGETSPGFQTPSLAYGPDFVFDAEGVSRTDIS